MKRLANIEDIVQHCLDRLDTGDNISSCLRDFPEHAEVLAPLLEVAAGRRWRTLPTLPAPVREAARLRARAALVEQSTARHSTLTPWRWNDVPHRGVAVAFALLLILGTFGSSIMAAQGSLPGDPFYMLKRSSEELRLRLAPDAGAKARLSLTFAERRLAESLALLSSGGMLPSSTIADIEQNYEAARELIERVPVAEQVMLQEHYNRAVLSHLQQLESRLNLVDTPDAHPLLENALRANIAGHMFDDVMPELLPTASASPSRTREPTRSTVTPTMVALTPSMLTTSEDGTGTAQPASSPGVQPQPGITTTGASTPGARPATTTAPVLSTTSPPSSTLPPAAPFRTEVPTPATDVQPVITDRPIPTEEPPPTRLATSTPEVIPTAGNTPTEEHRPIRETHLTDEAKPTDEPRPTDVVQPTDSARPTREPEPTDEPKPTKDKDGKN